MANNLTGTQVTKTAQELIYSVSNAIRILGKKYNAIRVQVWFNCVYVWAKGQVSRFVSKSKFRHQFVEFRKAGSRALDVTKDLFETDVYTVRNEAKDTTRRVHIVQGHKSPIQCTCEDYNSQIAAFGKAVCKHGYAVLTRLGFGSLAEYVSPTT